MVIMGVLDARVSGVVNCGGGVGCGGVGCGGVGCGGGRVWGGVVLCKKASTLYG
jgi:hypothetical protein